MNFGHLWNIYDVTIKTEYLKTKVLIAKKKKKMVSTEFVNVAISPYLTVYTVDKKNIKDFVRKMLVSADTMYKMVPSFLPWH
jgi:hypothetical protein